MAKVKGTALRSTVEFLKASVGEAEYLRLIESMAPQDQDVLKNPVLLSSWYEFSLLRRLMQRAEGKIATPQGHSLAWALGRFSAESALSTIYKLFFKMADPAYIIKKASYLYPTYYDSGSMEVVGLEDRAATIHIKGFDEPSAEFCDRMQGWMQRTVELTGHKSVTILHPQCRARGDAVCEYRGTWD
jgi:predicted hydrocarbon binding protein